MKLKIKVMIEIQTLTYMVLCDLENKFMVTKGERGWGGIKKEFEISRYKLLYIKSINNVLLYRTGNYIPYLIICHNGKEYIYAHN